MSIPLAIAIYLILWWLSFFTMLPLGAQSHHEADEVVNPGIERGAPRAHNLGRKALYAGRDASSSPAVGSLARHRQELAALLKDAFAL